MQRSRYCFTITMEAVFSMWFVSKCFKQGQSSSGMSERVQLCGIFAGYNDVSTKAGKSSLLRFVTRKRLVKTLQRNSHCGQLLPSND
jgi:hypothetical protein